MSSIEWTDVTWNPVRGCSRVSEGCRNCYAERMAARFSTHANQDGDEAGGAFAGFAKMTPAGPRWTGRVELIPSKLDEPLRWRKPRRVFVNSMSDLFHEALAHAEIARVFAIMADAPLHTFQILTKRPDRMRRWFTEMVPGNIGGWLKGNHRQYVPGQGYNAPWPLPNVWLGVSVEDQTTADERIPLLLQTPAAVRFVSYEPALGGVDLHLGRDTLDAWSAAPPVDWVIVGGESGPGARPCDVAWIRSVVAQCKTAGVACFVKQMGARVAGDATGFNVCRWHLDDGRVWVPPIIGPHVHHRPAEAVAFSLGSAKGGDPGEWPADLRVREFPR